jgi:hypothetical protein
MSTHLLSNVGIRVAEELLHLRGAVACHALRRDVAKSTERQTNYVLVSMSQIPVLVSLVKEIQEKSIEEACKSRFDKSDESG